MFDVKAVLYVDVEDIGYVVGMSGTQGICFMYLLEFGRNPPVCVRADVLTSVLH